MSSLQKYKSMRDFGNTPEPAGKVEKSRDRLKFVVQKHDASHLHYDFRLEIEGVLKSWAVPKGPSLDPRDKRLAMMTEDHPMGYRTFEGIIPEGHYGGGEVIVWDIGTYRTLEDKSIKEQERELLAGLHAGSIKFFLEGEKLHGAFALVKIKNSKDGKNNGWLLIKEKDGYTSEEPVADLVESVLSDRILTRDGGRSFGPTSPKASRGRGLNSPRSDSGKAKPKDAMPRDVRPMLATLVDEPFDREGWLFEMKIDGYRAIAELRPSAALRAGPSTPPAASRNAVRLYSRNGNDFNDRYPEIVVALRSIDRDAVLDGEVAVLDAKGKPQFQLLQHYGEKHGGTLVYYVFDLLYLDGEDLRKRPLLERKERLREIVPSRSLIRYSDHIEGGGKDLFLAATKQGLEGIIAKDGKSRYSEGVRTESWLKIKVSLRQEAVIAGFTEPRGSRKKFGALVLGVYEEDGRLAYIGHTGTGFNDKSIREIHALLEPLVVKKPSFAVPPRTNMPVTWVKPELVGEIKFTEWTEGGRMRHPVFVALREDKPAKDVRREIAEKTGEAVAKKEARSPKHKIPNKSPTRNPAISRSSAAQAKLGVLDFSNLDKVYWPKEGYTKGDLIDYYRKIAPVILPHLKDRPQSLHRHPNGIDGESFFQKNTRGEVPGFVATVDLRSGSEERTIRWMVCQNEETLLYLANLGCIELNPWNARYQTPDRPDYLIIDLDPDDTNTFDEVVKTALLTRNILEDADVRNYVKTSGKTGLHIVVPLKAKYTQDQARQFGEIIANLVHARFPEKTSVERSPAKRKGKIYVDFLQNRLGQTIAAPYSVRPWPGATVSAPLKWSEVKKGFSPGIFTMKTMLKRIDAVGDLWCPVRGKGIDLEAALQRLIRQAESISKKSARTGRRSII